MKHIPQERSDVIAFAPVEGGTVLSFPSDPPDLQSDEALMAKVAIGDQQAFSVLVQRHSSRLYCLAFRILLDSHHAEDAVQVALSKLWQKAPVWQSRGAGLKAWLSRIVVNHSIDQSRKLKRFPQKQQADNENTGDAEIADEADNAAQQVESLQLSQLVEEALKEIPVRQRTALILSYFEGHTGPESAKIMGIGVKAMESLLVRARQNLKVELGRCGVKRLCEAPSL